MTRGSRRAAKALGGRRLAEPESCLAATGDKATTRKDGRLFHPGARPVADDVSRSRSPCGARRIASRCLAPLSDHGLALAFPSHAASQDPSRPGSARRIDRRSLARTIQSILLGHARSSSSLVFTDSSFPSLAAAASQARRARARRPRRQSLVCSHRPPSRPQTCCGGSPN